MHGETCYLQKSPRDLTRQPLRLDVHSSPAYPGALLLTRPLSPAVMTRSYTLCSECSRSILSPLKSIPLLSVPATGYERVSVSPKSKPERISRAPARDSVLTNFLQSLPLGFGEQKVRNDRVGAVGRREENKVLVLQVGECVWRDLRDDNVVELAISADWQGFSDLPN